LVVLAPAVLLRVFVFGTFAVTSPSMEPALLVGDHLIAWKRPLTGAPQPWDLVLLSPDVDDEVPSGVDALVKRAVSAPTGTSEFVSVRGGDLWAGPSPESLALRRRPQALVDAQLHEVHRAESAGSPWLGVGAHDAEGGGLWLDGSADAASLRFGRAVRDGHGDDPGHDVVHDTGLALELRAPLARGSLRLRLREGADVYEARLDADDAGCTVSLLHNLAGDALPSRRLPHALGPGRLRFLNVDDELRLEIDGAPLLRHDVGPAAELPPGTPLNNAPALELHGARLELAALCVLRDQHYTSQGRFATRGDGGFPVYEVPAGSLFVLGDDSRRSRDSRHLGALPGSALIGRPFARYLPADRRGWLDRTGL